MHLLIPHAGSHAEGCHAVLSELNLPHLQRLLPHLTPQHTDTADALSLSPPHERTLAHAMGWSVVDGLLPWAAHHAHIRPELATAPVSPGWAFVTLCNWQVSTHEVCMRQLPMAELTAAESDQLLADMAPFFAQDGITLHADSPGRWLANGDLFASLPTASPDRVQGRNLEWWSPRTANAGLLVRLVSEMQMLLYTHPANDAREARGLLPVNALWFSGTGALSAQATSSEPTAPITPPTVANDLCIPAWQDDWASWARAWQHIDATHGQALWSHHQQGGRVQLTLCSEQTAQTWANPPVPFFKKMMGVFSPQPIQNKLKQL